MKVLAGDIGGTNARLAIVDVDHDHIRLLHGRTFASREFPSLAAIVREFLTRVPDAPQSICLGVACPVVGGHGPTINLPWPVNAATLASEIGVPQVTVINDFHAVARAVPYLRPTDLVTLQPGVSESQGVIAVIGAGTGLGEAFLTWDGGSLRGHDSEGGHATFGARTEAECDFLTWLGRRLGHVSREKILSGRGLVQIYHYLVTRDVDAESPLVRREMERRDPAAVISRHGLAGTDPLCVRALDMFTSAYGAQAANFALTVMATGGVYVAGGIAPRIIAKLQDGGFMAAFRDKGRLSGLLSRIPVHVIINPHIGLVGAAAVALDLHGTGTAAGKGAIAASFHAARVASPAAVH